MDAGISEGRPLFNPLEAAGPAYDTRNYRCRISGLLLVDLAPRAGQLQRLCRGTPKPHQDRYGSRHGPWLLVCGAGR